MSAVGAAQDRAGICASCGTHLAPSLLACPACRQLVHTSALTQLSRDAERAAAAGDPHTALARWQEALALLPPDSGQYASVAERVAALGRQVDAGRPAGSPPPAAGKQHGASWLAKGGGIGLTVALLAWKLKFVLVFVLTKAKLLLLGLTKMSTLLSMLASFGLYWSRWGWQFAAGFVLSIYIHEMGHVAALRRYGIKAGAPFFVPGLGAFVMLKQQVTDPRQDARVGLAGPIWGLGAALAAYAAFWATDSGLWRAIGYWGALINLFNLLPVWQLDGGRAFHALTRAQRWMAAGVLGAGWLVASHGLLMLLGAVAVWRAAFTAAPADGDGDSLWWYALLVLAFSLMLRSGGGAI